MFGRKERKNPLQRETNRELEDLRDDCIAMFIDSGMTQQQVHQAGGPTPATISKWLYRETMFPRMATIQSFVHALGCGLIIVTKETATQHYTHRVDERLTLRTAFMKKPRMPVKHRAGAKK